MISSNQLSLNLRNRTECVPDASGHTQYLPLGVFRVGDGITNLVLQENLQHTSGFGNFYRITLLECLGALKRAIWKVIRPNDVNRVNVSARLMSVGRLSVGMLLMGILRYHTRTCTEAIVCDLLAVPLALPVPSHTFSDIAYLYRWTHPAYPLPSAGSSGSPRLSE